MRDFILLMFIFLYFIYIITVSAKVRMPNRDFNLPKRSIRKSEDYQFVGMHEDIEYQTNDLEVKDMFNPIHYKLEIDIFYDDKRYKGSVEIEVELLHGSQEIHLRTAYNQINHKSVKVVDKITLKNYAISSVNLNSEYRILTINMKKFIEVGQTIIIKINFEKEREHADIFFNSFKGYTDSDYEFMALPYEDTQAHEMFPCFDGFGFYSTFDIIVVRPNNMNTIANMEIKKQEPRGSSKTADIYYTTPVMNANAVTIIVSTMNYTQNFTERGFKFRVWSPEERIEDALPALKISLDALVKLENYFNSTLPYSKIDIVPIPGLHVAGVSATGIISIGADILFLNSESDLKDVKYTANILTHEISHQWFGNMIFPYDPENDWLSEAYANFISTEIMEELQPEWKVEDSFILEEMFEAFEADSSFLSHPLRIPKQESDLDDEEPLSDLPINYFKGSCVFRTIKAGIGEEAFLVGVRRFVESFLFHEAKADDLWQALSQASYEYNTQHEDLTRAAHTWTKQMGYPVINVERNYKNGRVNLTQQRFIDKASPLSKKVKYEDLGYLWNVPITYVTSDNIDWEKPKRFWLNKKSKIVNKMMPVYGHDEWLLLNVNMEGFYRVNYDSLNWQMLVDQLMINYSVLTPANRASLFDDAFSLASIGLLDISKALDFTTYIDLEEDFLPFELMLGHLQKIYDTYLDAKLKENLKKYLIPKLEKKFLDNDWNKRSVLTLNRTMAAKLNKFMCDLKYKTCVEKTRKELISYLNDTAENRKNYNSQILCYGVKYGNEETVQKVMNLLINENDKIDSVYLKALSCSNSRKVIESVLEHIHIYGNPESKNSNFLDVASNPRASNILFNFLKEHWNGFLRRDYGEEIMNNLSTYVKYLNTAADLQKLKELKDKYGKHKKWNEDEYNKSLDVVFRNIQWIKYNLAAADTWLNFVVEK